MIQLITTEIELSQDEIKEAVKYWLYHFHEIREDDKDITLTCSLEEPFNQNITAKVTFTK